MNAKKTLMPFFNRQKECLKVEPSFTVASWTRSEIL